MALAGLQKASGWTARASPGMVSGVADASPTANAINCTLELSTNFMGGDIKQADGKRRSAASGPPVLGRFPVPWTCCPIIRAASDLQG